MNLPKISNYGNYASDNYGAHTLRVDFDGATFWFSYDQLIAFAKDGMRYIHQNDWSNTTGKHLNFLDTNKKRRLTNEQFMAKFEETFGNRVLPTL